MVKRLGSLPSVDSSAHVYIDTLLLSVQVITVKVPGESKKAYTLMSHKKVTMDLKNLS